MIILQRTALKLDKESSNFGISFCQPISVEFISEIVRDRRNLLIYYWKLSGQSIKRKIPLQIKLLIKHVDIVHMLQKAYSNKQ
jgi:hypothetical protein